MITQHKVKELFEHSDINEAKKAIEKARCEYHGEFANHG